jgi:hypothetical protein
MVGVVYRRQPYLVKYQVHVMAKTAQISKEKLVTTWLVKAVSPSAVGKTTKPSVKAYPLLQRISSFRVTSLRNCSPNKCFRVQVTDTSTSTVQRRLG